MPMSFQEMSKVPDSSRSLESNQESIPQTPGQTKHLKGADNPRQKETPEGKRESKPATWEDNCRTQNDAVTLADGVAR